MKKKVWLITYVGSANYGAALQLFATYKALEKIGCDVAIVNYENKYEVKQKSLKYLLTNVRLKQKIVWLISSFVFDVRKNSINNFSEFYKSMTYTRKIYKVNEMIGKADIYCVGSDQVWNPKITHGFDEVFCLANDDLHKKISFASSMGSAEFGLYDTSILKTHLRNFDALSVREQVAANYIKENITNKVVTVVDPTFLFDKDDWMNFWSYKKERPISDKYVLIYALGGYFNECNTLARQIANKIGAKVVAITLSTRKKNVDEILTNVTPELFVHYIANASFVVTNSFHGTCFSINLGIPFYSIKYAKNPFRASELLEKCGLKKRFYCGKNQIEDCMFKNDDILDAQIYLKEESAKSMKWLRNAIYE
ncbi:Polysaccharide pyruvyl transferase [Lachnospiraceae bacterium NLAE-zl-G231]|nr:Polysaccharide pyruvyl transferase [Lachnospiraceae bacterium NLAE-zl-G231]